MSSSPGTLTTRKLCQKHRFLRATLELLLRIPGGWGLRTRLSSMFPSHADATGPGPLFEHHWGEGDRNSVCILLESWLLEYIHWTAMLGLTPLDQHTRQRPQCAPSALGKSKGSLAYPQGRTSGFQENPRFLEWDEGKTKERRWFLGGVTGQIKGLGRKPRGATLTLACHLHYGLAATVWKPPRPRPALLHLRHGCQVSPRPRHRGLAIPGIGTCCSFHLCVSVLPFNLHTTPPLHFLQKALLPLN